MYDREEGLNIEHIHDVAVVGVGGVGSWVAYLLAVSGHVRRLYLIDPDVVEESNLNRTPYRYSDIGKPKALALANIIGDLGRRNLEVHPFVGRWENLDFTGVYAIDCRDFVGDDIQSDIIAGYDGKSMTIHINPVQETIIDITNNHGYTVPSTVFPPVLLASIVVGYLLDGDVLYNSERIRTFSFKELIKMLMGEDDGKIVLDKGNGIELHIQRASKEQYYLRVIKNGEQLNSGYINKRDLMFLKTKEITPENYEKIIEGMLYTSVLEGIATVTEIVEGGD